MSKQTVLLLGATGETGGSILNGLLEAREAFASIEVLVRPSSSASAKVDKLRAQGVKIRVVDIAAPVAELVSSLSGVDILISAIDAGSQTAQINLATAAKEAGVKRFVPCAFTTVAPPGGVMALRDSKEEVYQHVRKLFLPHTVIDVGYWHQISWPRIPSGRVDYALVAVRNPNMEFHAGGDTPNMLTDLRDIGRYVARIIQDPRTLNKAVATYSDVLSEREIFTMMKEMSGEDIPTKEVTAEEIVASRARAVAALAASPQDYIAQLAAWSEDYKFSKYVRGDNTPAYASYLGYLDASELYRDFKPITFKAYLEELLGGSVPVPYKERFTAK
ncbi:hypothetical protein FB45DRAFT_737838 [Roridomyces roridus]|uniref:NmrA-like domain-containing protein n=1 Tax=Roridomyces roridus TaxID=1738132 RepID=A0AAD7C8Q7_9AGAR|nr:hypothetical protein FB45DRAFT_737838 [Roridomyces roridus]